MKNNTIEEIIEKIRNAKNILILSHINPDGDCIGTASALALLLKKHFNKDSVLVNNSKIPEIYRFLPLSENFKTYEEVENKEDFDTVITVDCAAKDRLTSAIKAFDKAETTINFDHHKTNPYFAKYNYVFGDLSSAGEVLYNFAKNAGLSFDKDIANCLYTAILTDTGGFKFENTTAETFRAVADLMEYGINPCLIYRCCYESKPLEMVKLNAHAVSKSCFLCNGKLAYTIITLDDMKTNKALNEHTDGIVEVLRQVNSVDIAFVIKETDDGCSKISLRSKTSDVSKIAAAFNGGGHTFAAGCTIKKPYNVALNKILDIINEEYGLC